MMDFCNILKAPRDVATDKDAIEPLRLVLERPPKRRLTKLVFWTIFCVAFIVIAGIVIWVWGAITQKHNPGFWHVSLVSLLFWIGITQGMLAFSALLRMCHASWRYPLNRPLDIASLFGVWAPALIPFLVYARNEIYNLGSSGYRDNVWRVAGSTFWDAVCIGTAYVAGIMLLYLTSLPDFSVLRDRAAEGTFERRFFGRIAKWGRQPGDQWHGSDHQWRVLRRSEGVLVVGTVVAFVVSQTVLGWDFQLAAARNWDSSIFAPLYTLSSLLGAVAMTVLVTVMNNRVLRGRGFVTEQHYDNLGRVMIALGLVWFYFRWCDYLTTWYGRIPHEWFIQNNRVTAFPVMAGLTLFCCTIAPVFGNMFRKIRTRPLGLSIISVLVLIGVALQRYLDTVPTFAPNYPLTELAPGIPAILVFLGLAGMFVLTYLIAARYIPIMSWWGICKERTRTEDRPLGNATLPLMVEDVPVWET
jgi:molybdopterin-containing oxidoreductase family membrane subunit